MPRLLPLVLLLAVGCGGPPPAALPTLHPATGTLTTRDGKPVSGGALRFHATGGGDANTIVTAEVGKGGEFTIHTTTGGGGGVVRAAGAPAGKYQATYSPPAEDQSGALPVDVPEPVTVEAKENVLTLKLPKK